MIQHYQGITRDSQISMTSKPRGVKSGMAWPPSDEPNIVGNEIAKFLWLSLTQEEIRCLLSSLSARLPVEGPK